MSVSVNSTTLTSDAESVVHAGHFEADDAAADDQEALRDAVELERAGGIDDARVVRQSRNATGSEPAAMMHCSKPITPRRTALARDLDAVRGRETRRAADHVTLRCFARLARPPVSLPTMLVLPLRERGRVDLGWLELDAVDCTSTRRPR